MADRQRRRYRNGAARLLAAALALAAFGVHAAAPSKPKQELERIEKTIQSERARGQAIHANRVELRQEIDRMRKDLAAAAGAVQNREASVTRLEEEIHALEQQVDAARRDLVKHHGQLATTLSALYRLARRPQEAVLLMPGSAEDSLRAAMLLRTAVPRIEQEADGVRAELATLNDARAEVSHRRDKLGAALGALEKERRHMAGLVLDKHRIDDRFRTEEEVIAGDVGQLASRAKDIRELLKHLDADRRAREAAEKAAEARRNRPPPVPVARPRGEPVPAARKPAVAPLELAGLDGTSGGIRPVEGRIVQSFGEGEGVRQKGLTYITRPNAQVVAPYDGKVAFAGPFRGYGLLLIIDHGKGDHSLLTGFDRLDVGVGQWVLAGEPVGAMGGSGRPPPELYVEIRRNGQPVDPTRLLLAEKG